MSELFTNIINECDKSEKNIFKQLSYDSVLTRLTPTCSDEFISKPFCTVTCQESNSQLIEDDQFVFEQNFFPEYKSILSGYIEKNLNYDLTGYEKYASNCWIFNRPPIRKLKTIFESGDYLDLNGYYADCLQIKLICDQLLSSAPLQCIDLTNCELDSPACNSLNNFIMNNSTLKYLNLTNTRLGVKRAEIMSEGFAISQSLEILILKKCNLKDAGVKCICKSIAINENLKVLDLSYSKLRTLAGNEIGILLEQNKILNELYLNWNELCSLPLSKILLTGLGKNVALKKLNLSSNGFTGEIFSKAFSRACIKNKSLEEINLENNLLSLFDSKYIGSVIKKATNLSHIYLGNNQWTRECYANIINGMVPESACKYVSLGDQTWLTREESDAIKTKKKISPNLVVIFKGVMMTNPPENVNFRNLLMDRCKFLAMKPKKKKLKKEFGHFMHAAKELENLKLSSEEFYSFYKSHKIKLDDNLVSQLMDEFSIILKGKKLVDVEAMADYFLMRHPIDPID